MVRALDERARAPARPAIEGAPSHRDREPGSGRHVPGGPPSWYAERPTAMSVFQVKSGLLTLGPRVWHRGGRLYVRTSRLLRLLSLWSHSRTVVVDPKMRRVEIHSRDLWAWTRHRLIPFARIDHLDYRYGSLPTSFSMFHGTTDRVEKFTIEVVLENGEQVHLASFRGEGAAMTGMSGVLLGGDAMIDYAGNQEAASRDLVELLVDTIGVPLGKRLGSARVRVCSACGRHAGAAGDRCAYCGGTVTRSRQ